MGKTEHVSDPMGVHEVVCVDARSRVRESTWVDGFVRRDC